jgi:hypothetical protein
MSETLSPEAQKEARKVAVRDFINRDYEEICAIESSFAGYKKITLEQAQDRIEKLARVLGATVEVITELPEGLVPGEHGYVKKRHFDNGRGKYLKVSLKNKTMIVGLRDDQYFYADIYDGNEFDGGNHDFSLGELSYCLTR